MNQKNGKNSLGLDKCFEEAENPIELFKKIWIEGGPGSQNLQHKEKSRIK